ncbi:MAG: ion channel [Leptolyngbyaceae bacterium]|nr:ion channel [Leptolyngbyaceae bacterium]
MIPSQTPKQPQKQAHRKKLRHSRIVRPDGRFNVTRVGLFNPPWRDIYHTMLTMPWPMFFLTVSVFYLTANVLFACAYLIGDDNIANATAHSFADAFFFSVQTMASIGYGAMYPQTVYANLVVTIEALAGLMMLAAATGLMFARFSKPTARVLFSQMAVITLYDGTPTLMFRTANQRRNRILEANVQLTLVHNTLTQEGHFMRRFTDLPLVRSHSPIFALSWTVMHVIDEHSPLANQDMDSLDDQDAELIVTLTGIDETLSQTIHSRHSYTPDEIAWDHHFVDLFTQMPNGNLAIDYAQFHKIYRVDTPSTNAKK